MSRAFIKEPDGSEPVEVTERPISGDRNFVTAIGLKKIEAEINALSTRLDAAGDDKLLEANLLRDLRYWNARRASAELVTPEQSDEVRFGHAVTLATKKGSKTFHIVGQDEADPAAGFISYTSPLAQSLIGKKPGDEITLGTDEAEIINIKSSNS